MAMETEETVDNSRSVKRMKMMISDELPFVQIKTIDCEIYFSSVPEVPEDLKVSDLEVSESVETGPADTGSYDSDGSESTQKSKFKAQSGELESTTRKQSSVISNFCRGATLSAEKLPPEAELEEFFAAAQEGLNKRFKDKYNYDVVNDIHLKGCFEWIQVMPGK
ncbi:hypothetical protein L1987_24529 [Smallanthus sonchifolius]|uniref:Uncharacterized protein n=1 Tax=Smallanthus sonchifolius TaxID=185202 RepID=A0ACB9IKQ3_9ASTR|nr:hypothetical protein L1987_24529 [Smallanthus sonchifolius]